LPGLPQTVILPVSTSQGLKFSLEVRLRVLSCGRVRSLLTASAHLPSFLPWVSLASLGVSGRFTVCCVSVKVSPHLSLVCVGDHLQLVLHAETGAGEEQRKKG
jgi:hypothetical protein